jgi:hypothetical protein
VAGSGGWSTTGNTGTTPATNFLGTTDNQALSFRVNNLLSGRIETSTTNNTSFGYQASLVNTGTSNTSFGTQALLSNVGGTNSTAVGTSALRTNISGGFNTAVGAFSLQNNTGGSNVALGYTALSTSTTASNNVAVGYQAGNTITTGGNNTFLGYQADATVNNITNATALGYNAKVVSSNSLILGGTGANAVNVGIGANVFDGTSPEKLLVDAGATTSVNLMMARGTINNYLQINVKNNSNGNSASSDIVATADNGSETTNYIDMGINSSGYTGGVMGDANDAYLYNIGQDLVIGTGTAAKTLSFLTGGTAIATNERMRIDGTGNTSIRSGLHVGALGTATSTLQVSGSVTMSITTQSGFTYTPTANDYTIIATPSILGTTVTLPTAVGITGRIYIIKRMGALGGVTIDPAGSELIDGAATRTVANNESFMIQSTGAAWVILSKF